MHGQHAALLLMQSKQPWACKECMLAHEAAMLEHAQGYCCDSLLDRHGYPVHHRYDTGRNMLNPCCSSSQPFWFQLRCKKSSMGTCPSAAVHQGTHISHQQVCNILSTKVNDGGLPNPRTWQLKGAPETFMLTHSSLEESAKQGGQTHPKKQNLQWK